VSEVVGALVAGKYRNNRRNGAGGMGAVYEGEHAEIGKRVAIKVIERAHVESDELAQRFRREARAASAVESEHIVQVFDVGRDDGVGLYMVMELLSGEDLATCAEKAGGRLPVSDAVAIALQAARGLAKAHAAGVVHRDLKPANLFLTTREDGTLCVKILDFGISKLARAGADGRPTTTQNLTRDGAVMGTPLYMSPEQSQGLAVDARSDLWSLGALVYEILAGRRPYEDRDTYEQMIIQIATQKPRPLRSVAPWVSEAIAHVVEATLVHDVAARTQTAAQFAAELAAAAKDTANASVSVSALAAAAAATEAASPSGAVRTPSAAELAIATAKTEMDASVPARAEARGRPAAAAAAVVLALVVVAGVVSFVRRVPAPTTGSGLVVSGEMRAPMPAALVPVAQSSGAVLASTDAGGPGNEPASAAAAPTASSAATAGAAAPSAPPRPRGGSPGARPSPGAAPPPRPSPPPSPAPNQYGGAGVSTTY
jgi:serine/threonine-protein kinase